MLLRFIQMGVIFILIGGGIILYKQPLLRSEIFSFVPAIDFPRVKGIGTDKAGEITKHLTSDINDGVKNAQSQAMNMKFGDVVNFLNRGQKIATDFRSFQEYVREQAQNALKTR